MKSNDKGPVSTSPETAGADRELSWPEKALATREASRDLTSRPLEPTGEPPTGVSANPATHRKSRAGLIWGIVVVLLLGGIAGGLWWRQELNRRWLWEPIPMPEKMARVTAEWTPATLADRLKKSKKIRDVPTFLEAARQARMGTVAPGGYWLPAKAGPKELAEIFSQPPPLLKVTFPEGWTAQRMAERLKAEGFVAGDEFKARAYPMSSVVSPWEGQLFPDTYYLPRKGTAVQLATRLQARYREIMAELPQPFPEGYGKKRLTGDEVTILASLVERETSVPEERPLVAGVLLNRLRIRMRLQCDASVQYARQRAAALGQVKVGHKERLLFRDIREVDKSPYNTYKIPALPPGPICNPGEASLRAAARPRSSDYLFYVMSPRLGRHRFARTFEEHKRNIRLAKLEE